MTLTTQHLEELLRLALAESEARRLEALNATRGAATALDSARRLHSEQLANARAELEPLRARMLAAEKTAEAHMGRLYMDPDERKALARDMSEAAIRLYTAADVLRGRNRTLQRDCAKNWERMQEWAKKLRVST